MVVDGSVMGLRGGDQVDVSTGIDVSMSAFHPGYGWVVWRETA